MPIIFYYLERNIILKFTNYNVAFLEPLASSKFYKMAKSKEVHLWKNFFLKMTLYGYVDYIEFRISYRLFIFKKRWDEGKISLKYIGGKKHTITELCFKTAEFTKFSGSFFTSLSASNNFSK